MTKIVRLTFCLLLLLLIGCPRSDSEQFTIEVDRADSFVEVIDSDESTIFSIHSASGIGSASVTRLTGSWPANVIFRLHLRGLDELSVRTDSVALSVSVTQQEARVTRLTETGEQQVQQDEPFHMKARIVGSKGQKLPLESGYFEVDIPATVTATSSTLHIRWIDFYR